MTVHRFAEFELDLFQRQLTKDGSLIRLGSRAFDLLAALVSRANQVIAKEDLIREVWPDTVVAEGALRVHLASLRKALGLESPCPFIKHVAGEGYIFSVDVEKCSPQVRSSRRTDLMALPALNLKVIGRDAFVKQCLVDQTPKLLSIVGPGGIGKTTVASKIVQALATQYESVLFVDLGALSESGRIAVSLASLLGLSSYSEDAIPGIIKALGDRKTLIFFDNCEHLIEEAALVIEALVAQGSSLRIVVTSREPLRINGEIVKRLGPLEMPAVQEGVHEIATCPAIELFLERAAISIRPSEPESLRNLHRIAEIVRKLDGIPLAIEFAAARVVDLGIASLLRSLDNPLTVLRRGRRTAPPRQQTLRATLDWSYNCLGEDERKLLMVLSTFARAFTYQAAAEIAEEFLDADLFDDALTGLLSKSLISQREAGGQLRLLETTREYAGAKLDQMPWSYGARASHSRYVLGRLSASERDWDNHTNKLWMVSYGDLVGDLRSALKWSAATNQHRLFIDLAANSGLLWTQLGLMGEQFTVVRQALVFLDQLESIPAAETQLRSAFGAISYNLHSVAGDDEAVRQFGLAAKAAELLGDPSKALRAYSGICAILTVQGRYEAADELAWKVDAGLGLSARPTTVRIAAHNAHYKGNHEDALRYAREALESNGARTRGTQTSGASFGQRLLALMVMAKTAWITGSASKAQELLEEVIAEAAEVHHAVSSCLVLSVGAVPAFHGMGMVADARRHLDHLHHLSETNSLYRWKEWAEGYDLFGFSKIGDRKEADVVSDLLNGSHGPRLENTVVVAGKNVPDTLLDLAIAGDAGWCKAELYRLKGERTAAAGGDGRAWVEKGMDLAQQQKALLWQLRCAVSLVEMSASEARKKGQSRLETILSSFPDAPSAPDHEASTRALAL